MAHHDFVEGVRLTAGRYGMDLSRPLVLVSGGSDSVALLRAILGLGGDPRVLHVDHGLRGEESGADADFVLDLCEGLGVGCEVETLDLEDAANLQERAREARYRLAREAAGRLGLEVVATGHTADDVAETMLLNLSRGAGLRGLASIPPAREGLVRPLIDRTRREVLAYLSDLDQPYRTDPTNLTGKYARNRVRLEVMPVLEALHPGAASNLARAASLAREDLDVLEGLADAALEDRGDEVVLTSGALLALPPALWRHAVRRASARVLPGEIEFGGWVFLIEEVWRFDKEHAARPGVAYLDPGGGPYRVRMAREGDMIRPLGLGGRKKVFRAMMDRKVPRDLRRRTPVVVGRTGEVAWIPFGELGEGFGVGRETGRILKVEVAKR